MLATMVKGDEPGGAGDGEAGGEATAGGSLLAVGALAPPEPPPHALNMATAQTHAKTSRLCLRSELMNCKAFDILGLDRCMWAVKPVGLQAASSAPTEP